MKYILLLLFASLSILVTAQTPDWNVDAKQYDNSMNFVGVVNLDYQELEDEGDMVAAFINDECRGIAHLEYDAIVDRYIFWLTIYSNDNNEDFEFKIFDESENTVRDISYPFNFEANGLIGTADRPRIISDPELSSDALFETFEIPGQIGETVFSGDTILIKVPEKMNLLSIRPIFSTSELAEVTVDDELQSSEIDTHDFTNGVSYQIKSADESTMNVYQVIVIQLISSEVVASKLVSPNGDGVNDFWMIQNNEGYRDCTFYIYDSDHRMVYKSRGYDNGWNGVFYGKALPTGAYYYVIKSANINQAGTISLIR